MCSQRANLFLSDIPPHDLARDFMLLADEQKAELELREKLEVRHYAVHTLCVAGWGRGVRPGGALD